MSGVIDKLVRRFCLNLLCSIIFLQFILISSSYGQVNLKENKDGAGNPEILLENNYVKLIISPAYGGMVTNFTYKKTGDQWVFPDPQGKNLNGMFADHLYRRGEWPGECMASRYNYQIIKKGPEEAVVKLWYRLKGASPSDKRAGTTLEKEIILKDKLPYIIFKVRLVNGTSEDKILQYWLQNACIKLGKKKERNFYYRPSTRGIRVSFWERDWVSKKIKGEDYVKDPTAGWTGAVNPEAKEGVVFLMDYNYLHWLYNCTTANTIEWFYDKVSLKPGESWETEVITRPTFGFTSYSYASRNIIADTKGETEGTELKVIQSIAAMAREIQGVGCRIKVFSYPERKELGSREILFPELGLEPTAKTIRFPGIELEGLIVIKVKVKGKGFTDSYETYYDPVNKEKAYYGVTEYRIEPPVKQRQK